MQFHSRIVSLIYIETSVVSKHIHSEIGKPTVHYINRNLCCEKNAHSRIGKRTLY